MNTGRFGVPAGAADGVIAVGVAAALLVTGVSGQQSATGPAPLGHGLLVAGGLALAARRRAPVPVLAVTGLCAVGYQAAGFDVPAVAYLFAVYAAVRAGHRTATIVASVVMLAALPLAALVSLHDTGEAFARARGALELAWLIAAGAAGEALRQAERRADEAERTREETARRRADEERLYIARELHDSLTHQISVIKLQSEVAVHVARKRGEQVPEALLAIQEAGREAARELRATLEALRDDGTAPPPGLDDLPGLVERAGRAGLEASLTIEGRREDVPAAVSRTVYRIVQEALTNTARHAAAATASVRVDCRPDVLAVRVDDDGGATPDAAPVPGVGLLGMRERVTALGGRLRAEPRDGGGFTVRAELPLDRAS
ncbi:MULTISPECIES: sensor histidine kinase [Streptomyces]|uniref:histidine kinase n=2 Tax=Streptomyces TaxID=1883 RepID=A0A3R7ISM5_9ACTN|nr:MULTISPECIES: histidine kinase [Streptomyces]KNE84244.1 histidine kinase [Streptomyces fradiae]OFA58528.1 two-component sensor histidine kinase [Streptomyces fradiae]PQM22096.1 two-component sensor histidine kinase [Streptomyces xinghaiensis]RKM95346.1 two-component sensor histidine kinase [Streptomyces xinghaiensis]RNC72930.1 two-component sensor histidine kinase [Streptomyces xinghaiensis]